MTRISSLHFYPIKSCGGTSISRGEVTNKGFRHDRHWMVVDSDGVFLTQKHIPKMALIRPRLQDEALLLAGKGETSQIVVSIIAGGARRQVEIYGSVCTAIEDSEEAAAWLSDYLDADCKLVHMEEGFVRSIPKGDFGLEFADISPFLLLSEGSLADLNANIEENGSHAIPMNRFRPNIVVDTPLAFEEDSWARIQIGDVEFVMVEHAARCVITTINQETGEKGKEPLRILAQYRRAKHEGKNLGVVFGQRATNLNTGYVEVGMDVEVLEYKDPNDFSSLIATTS